MPFTSARRAALSCALLATTAFCGLTAQPAAAQSADPPVHQAIDENGVDLVDGSFNFSLVEASVGAGEGAMALVTQWGKYKGDNFVRRMSRSVSAGQATFSAVIGTRRRDFTGSSTATSFASKQGDGSTLTRINASEYRLTEADGSTTTFGAPTTAGFCATGNETSCNLVGIASAAADGRGLSYDWEVLESCFEQYELGSEPVMHCQTDYRLASITNHVGHSIGYVYAEMTPLGVAPTVNWFKRTGATLSSAAPGGATVTSGYAFPTANVTEVTDMAGQTWRLTYGQGLVGIRRPGSASDNITVDYGTNGVASVTRDGVATGYSRTVSGTLGTTVVTNALAQSRTVVSNLATGRPTQLTDELGRSTLFAYDGNGRLREVTRPEGDKIVYMLDTRGNVLQAASQARPGASESDVVTSASFAATCTNAATCNQPTSTTDARGNVTDFAYDPTHGGVTSVTAPAPSPGAVRPQTRYSYGAVNGVTVVTGVSACRTQASCAGTADEVKTTIAYTPQLAPSSVTSGAGDGSLTATQTMAYDGIGNLAAVDGPLAGTADTMRFRHDAARRRVGSISPDPDGAGPLKHRAERTSYRPDGQATKVERGTVNGTSDADWAAFSAQEAVEIAYDANSRPVTSSLVAGGSVHALSQVSYDALGRPECTAQRMNPAAFGALPASACTLGTAGSFGPDRISKTIRDAAGQVTQVKTALGTSDEADEVTSTYTLSGAVQTVTDAQGNVTSYGYDGHNRPKATTYPATAQHGATTETLTYESVNGGVGNSPLVSAFTNRAGETISFSHDALGRVILKDLPDNVIRVHDGHYRYDNFGRLVWMGHDAVNMTIGIDHDALGRVTAEKLPAHGNKSFGHDLAGRRTHMSWKDGFRINYTYLVTGEMETIAEDGSLPGAMTLATFGYDDRGNRVSLTRGNGTVTSYTPDAVSRLGTLALNFPAAAANDLSLGFAYNPAGQIATNTRSNNAYSWAGNAAGSTASTHNALNQIATHGGVSLTYDAKGNLTSDGARSYTYTSENRLKTAGTTNFYYDQLGRLNWFTGNGGHFDYEGSRVVTELEQGGSYAILRRYVHGPGADEPLVSYEGTGTANRRWLHADERGSIVAHSDASGAVTARLTYDEYGIPAATNTGRFQYTGQKWLPTLHLYDYKARTYDPRLGRFLEPDPIGYGDGMNMYAYVGGDPVNKVDPTGRNANRPQEPEDELTADEILVNGRLLRKTPYVHIGIGPSTPVRLSSGIQINFGSGCDSPDSSGLDQARCANQKMIRQVSNPCDSRLPDGSTINENVKAVKKRRRNAALLAATGPVGASLAVSYLYGWWVNKVREGGDWDYKIQPGGTQAQGNVNYGATGSLILPLDVLKRGAGAVQDAAEAGTGSPLDLSASDYGDDPSDVPFIVMGAKQCTGN